MSQPWITVSFLVVISLFRLNAAMASLDSIGPNGINSAGLTLPDGATPLTGDLIFIGQVEEIRPGVEGTDLPANVNSSIDPFRVRLQDDDPIVANSNIGAGHATRVAGVMISTDAVDSDSDGDAPLGVATGADLSSSAYITSSAPGYEDALLTTQYVATFFGDNVRAISHSWNKDQRPGDLLDGNSLLTLGMDWLARKHEVLHVFAGNQGETRPVPTDNYNGMTIARSSKIGGTGVFRQVSSGNTYDEDAVGIRTSIDLIAPGDNIELADIGDAEVTRSGTSYSVPHVVGTVALLQEYGEFQEDAGFGTWPGSDFRRHDVMKAVLMNSADKVQDTGDGKYLGMDRTVVMQGVGNTDTWLDSPAFTDQTIPLDMEMGTGHLNATRALEQFAPGQFIASDTFNRPQIGWDMGFTRDVAEVNKYKMGEIDAGVFISVTLAWDRVVNLGLDLGVEDVYEATDTFLEGGLTNLDLYLLPQGATGIGEAVWSSVSTESNVEHMFFEIPTTGDYEFWVYQQGSIVVPDDALNPFSYHHPYGIAWWTDDMLTIAGDFDNDGDVDAADLAQWEGDYGINGDSDADGDGDSDGRDFLAWQRNFGTGVPLVAGSQAVSEPTAWLLLALGGVFIPRQYSSNRSVRQQTPEALLNE